MNAQNSVVALDRANNFDALRLIAASFVFLGHGFILANGSPGGMFGRPFHGLGVEMFFGISGYLVTRSWLNEASAGVFLRKRALRILPGLTANVVLTACLLGPLATWLSLPEYFGHHQFWLYLSNVAFYFHFVLPGVFDQNPLAFVTNGSLWSLAPEVGMYAVVAVAGLLLPRRWLAAGFLAIGLTMIAGLYFAAGYVQGVYRPAIFNIDIVHSLDVGIYFIVGAVIAAFERWHRPNPWLGIVLLLVFQVVNSRILQDNDIAQTIFWVILPYALIGIGTRRWPILDRAAHYGDLSYGIYLYAFPIQQAVWWLRPGTTPWALIILAAPATFLCAKASWDLIENPALQFKSTAVRAVRVAPIPVEASA